VVNRCYSGEASRLPPKSRCSLPQSPERWTRRSASVTAWQRALSGSEFVIDCNRNKTLKHPRMHTQSLHKTHVRLRRRASLGNRMQVSPSASVMVGLDR